ncbi:50S ribosomal protein L15 [Lyticum sinuosum]|uniref:Large ribosomal subunit protein uL15 n=1 Tax=Lyticum sinuosum TaxID=1332059 RepID=A0AAE5AH69_9RICK|nr:50S ribosomal protein L15 [Lyticum sinuosum]MDZ5761642.1 50S ribosomal protein L15 [Lyticum sinuosum]
MVNISNTILNFSLKSFPLHPGSTRINGGKKLKHRVGRKGKWRKTSGRGGKGQTARSGSSIGHFEGGQTPLHRRLPKRGFKNINKKQYNVLSVSQLAFINEKHSMNNNITKNHLIKLRYIKPNLPIKILALKDGDVLSATLTVETHSISKKAEEQICINGGQIIRI